MSQPVGLLEILVAMGLSALAATGGGGGSHAVVQGQWVATGVLSPSLFTWAIAIGNLTPGPRSMYLAAIGYYLAGFPGAVTAFLGILAPAFFGAVGVSYAFDHFRAVIDRISLSAPFVIAGLIIASAWGTAQPLDLNGIEVAAVVAVTWLVGWRRVDPLTIVLSAMGIGLGLFLVAG